MCRSPASRNPSIPFETAYAPSPTTFHHPAASVGRAAPCGCAGPAAGLCAARLSAVAACAGGGERVGGAPLVAAAQQRARMAQRRPGTLWCRCNHGAGRRAAAERGACGRSLCDDCVDGGAGVGRGGSAAARGGGALCATRCSLGAGRRRAHRGQAPFRRSGRKHAGATWLACAVAAADSGHRTARLAGSARPRLVRGQRVRSAGGNVRGHSAHHAAAAAAGRMAGRLDG